MGNVDFNNEATFHVCVIPSELQRTCIPKEAVLDEVKRHRFSEADTFAIKLALEEALANAVKHGNRGDASKNITVRYAVTDDQAVVIVGDEGCGFAPDAIPDCTAPERLRLPNGRGIMLIRSYMDEVCFRNNGRELYFMKRRT